MELITPAKIGDEQKQRGFYTGCYREGFTTPQLQSKDIAQFQITNLKDVLDTIEDAFGYYDSSFKIRPDLLFS